MSGLSLRELRLNFLLFKALNTPFLTVHRRLVLTCRLATTIEKESLQRACAPRLATEGASVDWTDSLKKIPICRYVNVSRIKQVTS